MTILARSQIRDAVIAKIKNIKISNKSVSVLQARVLSVSQKDLPVILINYESDTQDLEESTSDGLVFQLSLNIVPVALGDDGQKAEAILDSICSQIISSLESDTTLGGKIIILNHVDTQFEASGGGEEKTTPILVARMNWEFLYSVGGAVPDKLI